MERKRKKFTAEQKVGILRQHIVDKTPVSDLCDEHGLHPTQFYRWQKDLFENGARVFEKRNGKPSKKLEDENARLKAKLAKKDEVIAELLEDHVRLKKKVGAA